MGWDGSEIMDAAIDMAHKGAVSMLRRYQSELGQSPTSLGVLDSEERDDLDEEIRPVVKRLAELLNDKGWDTQEESDYIDRFGQEMLGFDDNAYEGWLRHRLSEATHDSTPEEILLAAQRLKAHTDKMKAGNA